MSYWEESKQLSRAMLREKTARRKLMAYTLALLSLGIVMGTWLIDSFLESNIWLFASYWLAVLIGTIMLIVLCIYDMLISLKE